MTASGFSPGMPQKVLVSLLALSLVVAPAALVAGCGDEEKPLNTVTDSTGDPTRDVTPIQIAGGNDSELNVDKPTVYEITNDSELNELGRRVSGDTDPGWASTDFESRKMYAFVAARTRGGESIDIFDFSLKDGKVVIEGQISIAGPRCKLAKRITRPWSVWETRRFEGEPQLHLTKRTGSTCDGR